MNVPNVLTLSRFGVAFAIMPLLLCPVPFGKSAALAFFIVAAVTDYLDGRLVAREFMVTGLRLLALSEGKVISAGRWGKHKAVWQLVAIILILLGLAIRDDLLRNSEPAILQSFEGYFVYGSHIVSIAVAVITVLSGIMYLVEHKNLMAKTDSDDAW